MNFKLIVPCVFSIFLVACSQTPTVETDHLVLSPNADVANGKVVSVQEKKTAADGSKQAVGTLIGVGVGSLFGSGSGKTAAAVAGGVLGDAATNHYYGNKIESLVVQLDNGSEYAVDVKGNPFSVGDRVKMTIHDGKVSGIVHNY